MYQHLDGRTQQYIAEHVSETAAALSKLLRHRGPGAIRCQTAAPAAVAAGENE
jgi:hypothetical protein